MSNSELAVFTASIDAAWKDLRSFLAAVTPSQASKRDQAGWSVKDHVTHLAVWEDSVVIPARQDNEREGVLSGLTRRLGILSRVYPYETSQVLPWYFSKIDPL